MQLEAFMDWLRNNNIPSMGSVKGQACTVVIDGRSPENIVAQSFANRPNLQVCKHDRFMKEVEL